MTKEIKLPLTAEEARILNSLRKFPTLDKGSQMRLRARVDELRRTSKAFNEAFEVSIGSAVAGTQMPQEEEGILGTVKDVIAHPITALKGKIGETMLKNRNKAPKILEHPHKILSAVAEPVNFRKDQKEIPEIIRKLAAALRETRYGDKLGMAAPQIGISKRIFVCLGAVCINPEFTPPSDPYQKVTGLEGCYSVPGKLYNVERWKYGWATFYSHDGIERKFKLSGKSAIVYQHELSHLDGKCCCDLGTPYVPEKKKELEIIHDEA